MTVRVILTSSQSKFIVTQWRGVPFGTAMRAGKLATAGGDDYLRFLLNKGCVTISTVYLDDDYLGHHRINWFLAEINSKTK